MLKLQVPHKGRSTYKINLDHTPQGLEHQQVLDKLCEENRDMLLHQGDIGHMQLLTIDIDTGSSSYYSKTYTSPSKHTHWVGDELKWWKSWKYFI